MLLLTSTEVSPAICGAIEAAIGLMRDESRRQKRVRELSWKLRAALRENGWGVAEGESPIVPIILGGESEALEMSGRLLDGGFLVGAVRPPTVARGTSRLRVTVSSEHADSEVLGLVGAIGTRK